ncbi:MAG: type II toxin-antitoxin system VapC family toxin [Nitrospirota bacterium]
MNFLLDTCTFLWIITDAPELSLCAREQFTSPDNDIYLSVVSAWEISVKYALGRLPLPEPPERFIPAQRRLHGISDLPLEEEAALHVHRLPSFHADPFDRMLVSQGLVHGMILLTPDEQISRYPVRTAW